MTGNGGTGSANRVYVTSVGRGKYKETCYHLPDKKDRAPIKSEYAAVAAARLMDLAGARAILLLTEDADREHGEPVERGLSEAGLGPVDRVRVPLGGTEDEIWGIFQTIADRIPAGSSVYLEITNAFRHLPVVFLSTLAYLQALQDVRLGGIYYGAYEAKVNDLAPILDLSRLAELGRWSQATALFRQSGDGRALGKLVQGQKGILFRSGKGTQAVEHLGPALSEFHRFVASGLVLESAVKARVALQALSEYADDAVVRRFPVVTGHLNAIRGTLDRFATKEETLGERKPSLTEEELERQLGVIEWYIERDDIPKAIILLREWFVSRVLLARCELDGWVEHSLREPAERALGVLLARAQVSGAPELPETVARIRDLWNRIYKLRNDYAHPGFRRDWVDPMRVAGPLADLVAETRKLMGRPGPADPWRLDWTAGPTLLVTGVGMSRGVLYTALRKLRPEHLLVITSQSARAGVEEVFARDDVPRPSCEMRLLRDPLHGFDEVKPIVEDLKVWLLGFGKIQTNLTGGPTLFQYLIDEIARTTSRLGLRIERLALVDRRPAEEQKRDPYQDGEVVDLDSLAEVKLEEDHDSAD
ncbi:MAG: TIGR02221 family CRISPR-associated protein [Planctomycetes bacterium]|nr:TIGR02221 family CRISPR-associated protein [Planctomycetota bacterium]